MQNKETSISHRAIWAIAGPMILANLSTPLVGVVDTAVVGHLDSPVYLGAVALGTMLFTFLFWGCGFLRMVTTGLTSQANVTNSINGPRDILIQSGMLALIIALLILVLQAPIGWLAFNIMNGSSEVIAQAKHYYAIRIWSAPATLVNYAILGWLIGLSASRSALLVVLVINLINMILDILLVHVFAMNIDGVALASVIAEYSGLGFALYLLQKRRLELRKIQFQREFRLMLANRHHLKLHGNFMLRTLCLIFSFAFFTNQGAQAGTTTLAANMILLNFVTFMAYVLDGFANATEVLSGRAISHNNATMLKRSLLLNGFWSLLTAGLFSLVFWFLGAQIISLMTSIDIVATMASHYLIWVVLAPWLGVWSYLFDGLFVGATLGREMRNTMLFSTFCCYLPAWYLLQGLGNHGLWAALMIFLVSRGLSQSIYVPQIISKLN